MPLPISRQDIFGGGNGGFVDVCESYWNISVSFIALI